MNNLLLVTTLLGAFVGLILLPLGMITFWRRRMVLQRRSPLTQLLLRGPGESLRAELDDAIGDLQTYMVLLPVVPLFLYALHVSQSYILGDKESVLRTTMAIVSCVGAIAYFLTAIFRNHQRASKLRQGYEGEVAVAQELNQLMRVGAFVFHDVPAAGFNIDHVIVSPNGVYAVETKSRMKPKRDRGSEDANVVFDGQRLQFPGWSETEPLDQARRQAKWLESWLSSAVGEKVDVKPVLALPGWYVERKGRSDVVIINGKNATTTFSKLFHADLSEEMTKRIAHQLEQRCRDVEPRHFHKREKIAA